MTKGNWFLLITSAILYALAFIVSQQLWWLVFVFPLPFFYVALSGQLSFIASYLWGIIVFSLHLSGLLFSIVLLAKGSYFYRLIPPLFIVLYEAFFAAIIFWLARKVIAWLHLASNLFYKVLIWVAALWLFIHWIDWYCLWIFDRCEGYFFMHPLLPLVMQPRLLRLLPIIGKGLLSILLLMVPAWVTIALKTKKQYAIIATILFSLPWFISWFLPMAPSQPPAWVTKIVVLPVMFPHSVDLTSAMNAAGDQFRNILYQYPQVELIIMPESSFSCNSLSMSSLSGLWDVGHLGCSIDVVVGAFRWKKGKYFNSLHWVRNGIVQTCFDKRHVMILIERIPSWFDFWFIHNLYFKAVPEISPAQDKRPLLSIMKETAFVPYICSELFFNEWPDDVYPDIPILAICNDIWVCSLAYLSYVKTLMCLAAKFKAIQWQRNIVYVAFSQAVFFDEHGNETNLLRK
ncbi:MAG TPA: hypothetical protein ENI08_00020 [Candidatus Dependentiae bacterium]|nr:hypothetical protein [Candidatus Dependentiae bacterium]